MDFGICCLFRKVRDRLLLTIKKELFYFLSDLFKIRKDFVFAVIRLFGVFPWKEMLSK